MAKVSPEQPLVLSVLDRLLDDDPPSAREAPPARGRQLETLKQAVRRDLEDLLNSRRRFLTWPAHLTELNQSLVNYGLPDFSGMDVSSTQGREELRRLLETVIRRFEPRFKTLRVQLLEGGEPLDRTLRFRIDALLYADPAPEPVVYDSTLEPVQGGFEVWGGGP